MTTFDKERYQEEKTNIITLCREYDGCAFAAEPIALLINLLNKYLDPSDEDIIMKPESVYEVNYMVTRIISFLASLHEKVETLKHIENIDFLERQNKIK